MEHKKAILTSENQKGQREEAKCSKTLEKWEQEVKGHVLGTNKWLQGTKAAAMEYDNQLGEKTQAHASPLPFILL